PIMPRDRFGRGVVRTRTTAWLAILLTGAALLAQDAPESASDLLAKARAAQKAGDHAAAVAQFREFLKRHADHPEAPAVKLYLAVTLIDSSDLTAAREQLQPLAGLRDFADRPLVLLYLGLAERGLALPDLSSAEVARRTAAGQRLAEAGKHFTAAADAFA